MERLPMDFRSFQQQARRQRQQEKEQKKQNNPQKDENIHKEGQQQQDGQKEQEQHQQQQEQHQGQKHQQQQKYHQQRQRQHQEQQNLSVCPGLPAEPTPVPTADPAVVSSSSSGVASVSVIQPSATKSVLSASLTPKLTPKAVPSSFLHHSDNDISIVKDISKKSGSFELFQQLQESHSISGSVSSSAGPTLIVKGNTASKKRKPIETSNEGISRKQSKVERTEPLRIPGASSSSSQIGAKMTTAAIERGTSLPHLSKRLSSSLSGSASTESTTVAQNPTVMQAPTSKGAVRRNSHPSSEKTPQPLSIHSPPSVPHPNQTQKNFVPEQKQAAQSKPKQTVLIGSTASIGGNNESSVTIDGVVLRFPKHQFRMSTVDDEGGKINKSDMFPTHVDPRVQHVRETFDGIRHALYFSRSVVRSMLQSSIVADEEVLSRLSSTTSSSRILLSRVASDMGSIRAALSSASQSVGGAIDRRQAEADRIRPSNPTSVLVSESDLYCGEDEEALFGTKEGQYDKVLGNSSVQKIGNSKDSWANGPKPGQRAVHDGRAGAHDMAIEIDKGSATEQTPGVDAVAQRDSCNTSGENSMETGNANASSSLFHCDEVLEDISDEDDGNEASSIADTGHSTAHCDEPVLWPHPEIPVRSNTESLRPVSPFGCDETLPGPPPAPTMSPSALRTTAVSMAQNLAVLREVTRALRFKTLRLRAERQKILQKRGLLPS